MIPNHHQRKVKKEVSSVNMKTKENVTKEEIAYIPIQRIPVGATVVKVSVTLIADVNTDTPVESVKTTESMETAKEKKNADIDTQDAIPKTIF